MYTFFLVPVQEKAGGGGGGNKSRTRLHRSCRTIAKRLEKARVASAKSARTFARERKGKMRAPSLLHPRHGERIGIHPCTGDGRERKKKEVMKERWMKIPPGEKTRRPERDFSKMTTGVIEIECGNPPLPPPRSPAARSLCDTRLKHILH